MMLKQMVAAGGLLMAGGLGPASAQTFMAWGHEFTLAPSQPRQVIVAIVPDSGPAVRFSAGRTHHGRMTVAAPQNRMRPRR